MTPPALHIDSLSKLYGTKEALKKVSLNVAQGDFFALLGPNGAGKSTLIGIITSLVNKNSGSVQVFGYNIDNQLAKAKSCIGLVPQEFNFNAFEKVEDIIIQQAGYYGLPRSEAQQRCHQYLKQLELLDKRRSPAIRLSGGMKRRLMIARALVHRPRLLILDEPTAGVDIEVRRLMWEFLTELNKQGTTIILTTHYLEEAEQLCRNIAIIDQGEVIANTSMKKLLRTMNTETYVLDLATSITEAPRSRNVDFRLIDDNTLEATISNHLPINNIFTSLSNKQIEVSSLRAKSNRLEELFLNLTRKPS